MPHLKSNINLEKSFEKMKLIDLLKTVDRCSICGLAIHSAIKNNNDIGELVLELQSQYIDNPDLMKKILGVDLADYIMKPFKERKQLSSLYLTGKI